VKSYRHSLYRHLLAGRSDNEDTRRHEFILNVQLCGLILAGAVAELCALFDDQVSDDMYHGNTLFDIGLLTIIMLGLWWLSRTGRYLLSAYIFLGCISFAALNMALRWSFEMPTTVLLCSLLVVIAGLILKARAALCVTIIVTGGFLTLGHAQIIHRLYPNTDWLDEPLTMSNNVDYSLILSVIGLVSWLSNQEIDRSLKSARMNRAALAEERDGLETKVAERTHELEQIQLARLLELQRFADFGRLSAQLLHEVSNPLTAASINLQQINHRKSQSLRQACQSLQQLERYVDAARKQLKRQSQATTFSVNHELKQLLVVLTPLAQSAGATLMIDKQYPMELYGDPVKFNQIIANLVGNAIDAYADSRSVTGSRQVNISFRRSNGYLAITVHDWGHGISPEQLPHLFEPFYTTKLTVNRGLGIGLAMVQQSVVNDFNGTINVKSSVDHGTSFSVKLKLPTKTRVRQYKISSTASEVSGREPATLLAH
jgi:signal transduction histidine kinase